MYPYNCNTISNHTVWKYVSSPLCMLPGAWKGTCKYELRPM